MIHSILFFGNIHEEKYGPEDIFGTLHDKIRERFPEPFSQYTTCVPQKTPFSYFLELVVKFCDHAEDRVKEKLSETLRECGKSGDLYPLIAVVICICEIGDSRYYGASLSCGSDKVREIMTTVSCLHVWHPKVSSAVMSVFPDDTAKEAHGIILPDSVKCKAYAVVKISKLKRPCKRCSDLFSLPNNTDVLNYPGNCAETEAISNFLHAEPGLKVEETFKLEMVRRVKDKYEYDVSVVYV
ncbi:uncharacterized protein LOC128317724 [Pangasianodon hypophthalmus]|uniref:uncharacterized protein LOC128317724 n=1 Tax=Pangasianodon hypophthalmus TaxID=310915 RepID=UPI0023076D82|nr:uncharacterized protein LOC128317724 [Pangasianodon hypophthalmus]